MEQVSEKERKLEYENLFRGIATLIAEKCVDPNTNRPYTITMIERAMKDVHFNVDPKKSAKVQAFGEVRVGVTDGKVAEMDSELFSVSPFYSIFMYQSILT